MVGLATTWPIAALADWFNGRPVMRSARNRVVNEIVRGHLRSAILRDTRLCACRGGRNGAVFIQSC